MRLLSLLMLYGWGVAGLLTLWEVRELAVAEMTVPQLGSVIGGIVACLLLIHIALPDDR